MTQSYLQYNDPIVIEWRDALAPITETRKVISNLTVLSEIPDPIHRVVISGFYEVTEVEGELNTNEFMVNYQNGVVLFNPAVNTQTLTCVYQGRGSVLYPAERVFIHNDDPNVVTSLQTLYDSINTTMNNLNGEVGGFQSQLDAKQNIITGAASSITTGNLSVSKALVSDSSGKVSASSITATELGYISGVTSGIQSQLNNISSSISTYTHNQSTASTTWIINHNKNSYPSVTIVDGSGSVIMGDVVYTNANTVTIAFTTTISGKAYLH